MINDILELCNDILDLVIEISNSIALNGQLLNDISYNIDLKEFLNITEFIQNFGTALPVAVFEVWVYL